MEYPFSWKHETGFEPATLALARRYSTTEPLVRNKDILAEKFGVVNTIFNFFCMFDILHFMKKHLLVAINAKYIHFNPAVYSLRAYAKHNNPESEIEILNFTINQDTGKIVESIYNEAADVIGFSCYIWNISVVKECVRSLKKVMPNAEIWLGGPEVSYNADEILNELPVRGVMIGEGEETFSELVQTYDSRSEVLPDEVNGICDNDFAGIKGLTFITSEGKVVSTPVRMPMELDRLPFYYDSLTGEEIDNHILYYESSRGCPYSCSYCLSSLDKTLRFKSIEKVKAELDFFINRKVRQVKFVDRTFNCKSEHALAIWQYIKEHDNGVTNFHFEIASETLTEEELELLCSLRPGLVRLEIGVQTTNADTLKRINRRMDIDKLKAVSTRIIKSGNIHLHLDLIAGLPEEGMDSFINSFNEIYSLHAHELQLGFLKVLKGTQIEAEAKHGEIIYEDKPPYEVLKTDVLSFDDLRKLKAVEEMLEIYYNSGQFVKSVEFLEKLFNTPYELYEALAEHYRIKKYDIIQPSRLKRYDILLEFFGKITDAGLTAEAGTVNEGDDLTEMKECLLYDLYEREELKKIPEWAGNLAEKYSRRKRKQ